MMNQFTYLLALPVLVLPVPQLVLLPVLVLPVLAPQLFCILLL
jgi:hypothetical protein